MVAECRHSYLFFFFAFFFISISQKKTNKIQNNNNKKIMVATILKIIPILKTLKTPKIN